MRNYEKELTSLILAGAKVIEIVSYEWERVHGFVDYVSEDLKRSWFIWSSVNGIKRWNVNKFDDFNSGCVSVSQALDFFVQAEADIILVLEDFHPYSDTGNPINVRHIKEMMRKYNYGKSEYNKTLILSSPYKFIPEELNKELPVIEIDLPGVEELNVIARSVMKELKLPSIQSDITNKLLESALGLTIMEARLAFGKAIIERKKLTEEEIPLIINEKEQIIKKSGLLEYYHPTTDLNSIGGLENLKEWIRKRGNAYTKDAKEFGLTTPRGLMLLGVPGCGKSLTAKAIAKEWQFPLLRFDLGKVFGGIVGESEKNIRYALDIAKTISPCILWIDEIEKGLSGSQSSNRTDGGTSARVFGTFLTWMQEKLEPVFVVATANDISQLPHELLRKGRFDEIFFVDLPSAQERKEIFKIHLNRRNRDVDLLNIDLSSLVDKSEGFSGAEIEEAINDALFTAFDNKQSDVTSFNIEKCLDEIYPLSTTMSETISGLRKWAEKRARLASKEKPASVTTLPEDIPVLQQEQTNPFIKRKIEYENKD
ncbi:MAG TPA: AAA family ATPase [Bacilli bacterium]|nr:AAA family ATPase [Bacilli bacterium]